MQLLIGTAGLLTLIASSVISSPVVDRSSQGVKFDYLTLNSSFVESEYKLLPECEEREGIAEIHRENKAKFAGCMRDGLRSQRSLEGAEVPHQEEAAADTKRIAEAKMFLDKVRLYDFAEPCNFFTRMQGCVKSVDGFMRECVAGGEKLKGLVDTAAERACGPEHDGRPVREYMLQAMTCLRASSETSLVKKAFDCIDEELYAAKELCGGIEGLRRNCVNQHLGRCAEYPDLGRRTMFLLRHLGRINGCRSGHDEDKDGE